MRATNRDHVSHDATESIQRSSVVGLPHRSKMDTTVPSSANFSSAELDVRLAIAAIYNSPNPALNRTGRFTASTWRASVRPTG
jgi:hypothetical protein